jgi:hypothetical protein
MLTPLERVKREPSPRSASKARARRGKRGILTKDDPIEGIVGIGDTCLGDVSATSTSAGPRPTSKLRMSNERGAARRVFIDTSCFFAVGPQYSIRS